MNAQPAHPMKDLRMGTITVDVDRRPDGTVYVVPQAPLAAYPERMTDPLTKWAELAPSRVFLAQRNERGAWRSVTYGEAQSMVRRLGKALLERGLSAERPLLILSGNEIEHALLALAAHHVGVPYAPVSPAYSLVSQDFGRLRYVVELLTPGLVYASDGRAFARAIAAAIPPEVEVTTRTGNLLDRAATPLSDLLATPATTEVDQAHDAVRPETIAKFLLTSGSTDMPKAVITTHRMLCSNQVMLRETLAFLKEEPPAIVDWLPWNHTFGGNHNVGLVLFNGGSLYIDDGKPTPEGIAQTVRNLRDIAPTVYFNVPKGYEMLVPHLRGDRRFREHFFSRLQANFFAGAGLSAHVWAALDDLAVETVGARVPMLTGLGATETAPFSLSVTPENSRSGHVGLPVPGNLLKLVPVNGKLEARVIGPNVTPGYWRRPDLTAKAFDEEGYYSFGDALRFVDEADITQGFAFDGRISEDFKLASGTWVSVGPLRARLIVGCAPFVKDVVVAGLNRDEVAVLVFPDVDACREFCGLPADAPLGRIVGEPVLRQAFRDKLIALARTSTGTSNRVVRAILLDTPPSIDLGEITDKGSINQSAVLRHRADAVDELYQVPCSPRVIGIE